MDLERLYRDDAGRALATLIRLLGDFDAAEEALQDAFALALTEWPEHGVPAQPRAWLVSTARHKAIDALRRRAFLDKNRDDIAALAERHEEDEVTDDRLRLLFTCCHPALAPEAQVSLTLRTLCGLRTEEIARAFLVPAVTMAQRIVRAKSKIRAAGIPYQVPADDVLPQRLDAVLVVIYLVFNEGYAATAGDTLVRRELCAEAIRLARLLVELLPGRAEARGLLALLLLSDSRRDARTSSENDVVLLEEQDRALWDRAEIDEGLALVEKALRAGPPGPYTLQAAIAAVHAQAARAQDTDWRQIAALYTLLLRVHPTPIVELNRAVAIAMADGIEAGLRLVEELHTRGVLDEYHLLHAARADLLRRLGRRDAAAAAYRRALALAGNEAERRFLARRLDDLVG